MPLNSSSNNLLARWGTNCPKLSTVLLWMLGLTVLIGLTVKDFRPLLSEYQVNNVATQMQVVAKNETIKPPPLTVCVPRNPLTLREIVNQLGGRYNRTFSECVPCVKLTEHFLDIRDENITLTGDPTEDYLIVASVLFERLLKIESQNDFEILSLNNSGWNQPLIDAVWTFFDCLAGFDKQGQQTLCSMWYNVDFILSEKSLIEILYDRLITILCQFVAIGDGFDNNLCLSVIGRVATRFSADTFCFKFDIMLSGSQMIVNAQSPQYGAMAFLTLVQNPFYVFADTAMIKWPLMDIEANDVIFVSETANIAVAYAHEYVNLKYIVQSVVTSSDKRCYKESTPETCLANCMFLARVDCYQCLPYTTRKNRAAHEFDSLPYCNSTHYETVTACDSEDYKKVCNDNCSNPCEYISYQWHSSTNFFPLYTRDPTRYFSLIIKPVGSPFVQFNITRRQTWEQFVADVAGIVNLYLGFSGLTVVAILTQLIDAYEKWSKKRKSVGANGVQMELAQRNEHDTKTWIEAKFKGMDENYCELKTCMKNLENALSELSKR